MIPLCDSHRHAGGSLGSEFIYALSNKHNLGYSLKQIRKATTFQQKDRRDFQTFLTKFDILNKIPWDEIDIIDLAHVLVAGLINEGINYSEIRMSINKYMQHTKMTDVEMIKFIRHAFDDATNNTDVEVALILSIKYDSLDSELESAMRVDRYSDCVVGVDLVGNEAKFDVERFRPMMDIWRSNNKILMAHAGETQSAKNVRDAIIEWKVNRIAHGIRVPREDPDILNIAKDMDVCFDIAVTSNYLTGVVKDIRFHPAIKMMEKGVTIIIGTDDPTVFKTSLEREYRLIQEFWGLSPTEIIRLKRNAVERASLNRKVI